MRDAFLMLIKIVFAILLIPVCYAVIISFSQELSKVGVMLPFLLWGAGVYILLQLFFYTPQGVFQVGQKIFGEVFKSVPVLAAIVPLFVPIIPTVILLAAYITTAFFDYKPAGKYLMICAGFSIAMHLILSAHAEFEEDNSVFKPHYLFLFSLTLIFNIIVVALLLAINFSDYSFIDFFMSAFVTAKTIYTDIYTQLFVVK